MGTRSLPIRIALVAAGLVIAACSTPAVTGMKVHMQNGEYEEAIHLADSVIANGESQNAEVWLWRGKAQGNIRDWLGASESFVRVFELKPELAPELTDYWFVFYNSAALSLENGDTEGARGFLQSGIQIVPSRPEYDQMLGDIALGNDDYELAVTHFGRAAQISGQLVTDLEAQLDAATPEQAPMIQEALDGAVSAAILSYYNTGMLQKALSTMTDDPAEAGALLDEALVSIGNARALDPVNADVLSLLAQIYLLKGEYEQAMGVFEEAMTGIDAGVQEGWITPEDAQIMKGGILVTRGAALLEMERYEEAAAELETALSYLGDDYLVLGNLAQAYIMLEEYEQAVAVLDRAVMISSLDADQAGNAWYMKFAALTKLERDAEAAASLERALEFIPDNPDWWEYLASTYSRLGRRNDAIEAMEHAQQIRGTE